MKRTLFVSLSATISAGLGAFAVVASLAGVNSGCSARPTPSSHTEENTGTVGLALQLASGEQIDTVNYTITGPGGFTTSGTLDVTNSTILTGLIGGIPAGTGYTIVVTAIAGDGGTNCVGSGTFDVVAGTTATVPVTLRCVRPRTKGSVAINGTFNECPTIETWQALPGKNVVGATIALGSSAHDNDMGPLPLTYAWTSTSGTVSGASAPNATLTCTAVGQPVVSLTVSDGDPAPSCADTISMQVICVACIGNGSTCDDNNVCTLTDTCHAEACVGSNPAPARTPCPQNKLCDGAGACVECLLPSDCPGTDSVCSFRTCTAGVCGINIVPAGPTPMQTAGDCKSNRCDGAGHFFIQNDDTDVPIDATVCTADICTSGVPSNPSTAYGAPCTESGGQICNGDGACVPITVEVARVGDGSALLNPHATQVFIEQRKLDGTVVGAPISLPTTSAGANLPVTVAGTNIAEGTIARSVDGRFLTMAGYGVVPGTLDPANNVLPRVVARIDASGTIDSSTVMGGGAFVTQSVRTAVSLDGSTFWVGGLGANATGGLSTGGIWYVARGATGGTQLGTSPVRVLGIFGGQLFGTGEASLRLEVFKAGSGMPTSGPVTVLGLPGMPSTAQSPGSFVFFDMSPTSGDPSTGADTVYVAVSAAASQGIQKWTYSNVSNLWSLSKTLNLSPPVGFRGLTGLVTGANVTLVASTTESPANRLVVFVDDGSAAPVGTPVATGSSSMAFRGVALPPHH